MTEVTKSMRPGSLATAARILICLLLSSCGGQSSSPVGHTQTDNNTQTEGNIQTVGITLPGSPPGGSIGTTTIGSRSVPLITKVSIIHTNVFVSWVGTGYQSYLYKNGSLHHTYPGTSIFGGYAGDDVDLITGERVCYQVRVSTREGVFSALSDPVCVVPGTDNQYYERQVADVKKIEITDEHTLELYWENSTDDENLGYRIYRNQQPVAEVTQQFYSDKNLQSGDEYCYHVTVVDNQNQESPAGKQRCETPRTVWQSRQRVPAANLTSILTFGDRIVAMGDDGDYLFSSSDGVNWTSQTDSDYLSSRILSSPFPIVDSVQFGSRIIGVNTDGLVYSTKDTNWFYAGRELRDFKISSLAASESTIVAVGADGSIFSSSDAVEWVRREVPAVTETLVDVKWINERFVAVGQPGVVLFSADGVEWEVQRVRPETDDPHYSKLQSVLWTGESYITFAGHTIFRSGDGVGWDVNTVTGMAFSSLTWSDDLALLVGVGAQGKVATSRDGSEWNVQELNAGGLNEVIWDAERFIAVGGESLIVTSDDGIHWKTRSKALGLYKVVSIDNTFYALGGLGHFMKSADGLNWEYVQTGLYDTHWTDIAGDGEKFIITGASSNYIADPAFNEIREEWHGTASSAPSVIWDGERFVIVRPKGIRITTDGAEYSPVTLNDYNYSSTRTALRDIAYKPDFYVVVGNSGEIFTTTDPTSFTPQASPTTANLWAVATNGEGFVAVGADQTIVTSIDGTDWNVVPHETYPGDDNTFRDVIWAGDHYVAVGLSYALTSPNGIDWQILPDLEGPAGYRESVAFNGDRYVVVSSGSRISTFERY